MIGIYLNFLLGGGKFEGRLVFGKDLGFKKEGIKLCHIFVYICGLNILETLGIW